MVEPKLVDMKFTKDELKEEKREYSGDPTMQPYPWGLAIRLESTELAKLGLNDLPQVGGEMHLICVAEVTGVNMSARVGQEDETCVALQITHMQVINQESAAVEKGERESAASESAETRSALSKYR